MANIDPYVEKIKNAVYGEEVRDSIVNALKKVNDDNESYNKLKQDVTNAKSSVDSQVAAFDTKVKNAQTTTTNLTNATSTGTTTMNQIKQETEKLVNASYDAKDILNGVQDLKTYLGYVDSTIVGVQVDYENKAYKRLAGAYGLNGGADFDKFAMYGGRKRCNVADNGTINAWYGDAGYKEDGSNGQVMVYQPAFWYKVVPLKIEKQSTGIGYHLRKANYYVSDHPVEGFKLHPLFHDKNGREVDHVFRSAFRGSIYDKSASAYLKTDEQVMDPANDLFCSIAGVKPASGWSQDLTRVKIEQIAANRGDGWHGDLIRSVSAEQLLMMIEYCGNLQTKIGMGVVSIPWSGLAGNDSQSYAVNTGGTSSLGNKTGEAAQSTQVINGQTLTNTASGKRSVSYRGVEDPWGDLWEFVYDVNIWGNGSMGFGMPYICTDFNFAENKNSGNYEAAGFTLTPKEGYISAMGYSEEYDWVFFASETDGNSSLPVGDYQYGTVNLNGYRIAHLGGSWGNGGSAGAFYWYLDNGVGTRYRTIGGRLVYIPTRAA